MPSLRFPEFSGAPAWNVKLLGTVFSFFKGKGLPKSALSFDGRNLCIHYGELFTNYSEVINNVKSRTNLNDNCFLSIVNDVLMPTSDVTPRGLAKACCINIDGVVLGGDILVIRPNKSFIHGEFLSYLIRSEERKILQIVSGSTVFHLYASSMEKLRLAFPSLGEQKKIADCLQSLDELILATKKKLELLENHKKGLMQALFPALD